MHDIQKQHLHVIVRSRLLKPEIITFKTQDRYILRLARDNFFVQLKNLTAQSSFTTSDTHRSIDRANTSR